MRNILITGGGGYVGIPLTERLLAEGHAVTIHDRFYFGRDLVSHLEDRVRIVAGDIRDENSWLSLLEGIDTVVYLACLSNDPSCELEEDLTREVNYNALTRFAERAKSVGVRDFVFFSSCSVYGAGGELPHDEKSATHPVSLYAELKLRAENFLLSLQGKSFRPLIFRNATLFGLSPRMRFDLAINVMTLFAFRQRKIFILGGGQQWRPFLHVGDLAEITALFLRKDLSTFPDPVFNIGVPELNLSIAELAEIVAEEIGDIELEVAPGDADRRSYKADFQKLLRTIEFAPKWSVKASVREIYDALSAGRLGDVSSTRYYNIRKMQELLQLPARAGGERTRSTFLPFCLPKLGSEEEAEVVDTLRSGWITTGPKVARFEKELAEFFQNPNTMAISSCTAALHLSLLASGVGPGDEVITSPITFASTANVIVHTGAKPVFADVDPRHLLLDPEDVKRKITPKTKAIIPVDLAGQSCDMDVFRSICDEHNLALIQDAAHSIGAEYKGQPVGSLADYTCFSFYAIKNMTTAEGGALTFKDPAKGDFLREMGLHGMSRDAWKRYDPNPSQDDQVEGPWPHWDILHAGFKYNMTDIQAAIGLHQLKRLHKFLEIRREYADEYRRAFADLPEIQPLEELTPGKQAWHLFIIKLQLDRLAITRDEFLYAMKGENIGTGIHFRAVHLSPYYRQAHGCKPGDLPHAELASESIVSLPLYPGMTRRDQQDVIDAVRKVIKHYRSQG